MSTIFWKALKVSPAIVGASLFVASSAYAAGQVSDQTVTGTSAETAVVSEATVATDTGKSSVD